MATLYVVVRNAPFVALVTRSALRSRPPGHNQISLVKRIAASGIRAEIQVRFVRDKSATPPALDAGFFLKTQHQKGKRPPSGEALEGSFSHCLN
jgi:hypothetical protein